MFTIISVYNPLTGYQQVANGSPTVGQNSCLKHDENCRPTVGQLLADSIFRELFFTFTDAWQN